MTSLTHTFCAKFHPTQLQGLRFTGALKSHVPKVKRSRPNDTIRYINLITRTKVRAEALNQRRGQHTRQE
jgi:hypothetical protein